MIVGTDVDADTALARAADGVASLADWIARVEPRDRAQVLLSTGYALDHLDDDDKPPPGITVLHEPYGEHELQRVLERGAWSTPGQAWPYPLTNSELQYLQQNEGAHH